MECEVIARDEPDELARRCRLTIAPSEEGALSEALSRCPDEPVAVTLAR
ncbi:hypothetical protein [Streptomyces albicerus]|nr:hypothetical protein [Streptomyces albicerus]